MAQLSHALKVGVFACIFISVPLPVTEISCPVSVFVLTLELSL